MPEFLHCLKMISPALVFSLLIIGCILQAIQPKTIIKMEKPELKVNDLVTITKGSFKDLPATVSSIDTEKNMIGVFIRSKNRRVYLSPGQLKKSETL